MGLGLIGVARWRRQAALILNRQTQEPLFEAAPGVLGLFILVGCNWRDSTEDIDLSKPGENRPSCSRRHSWEIAGIDRLDETAPLGTVREGER